MRVPFQVRVTETCEKQPFQIPQRSAPLSIHDRIEDERSRIEHTYQWYERARYE